MLEYLYNKSTKYRWQEALQSQLSDTLYRWNGDISHVTSQTQDGCSDWYLTTTSNDCRLIIIAISQLQAYYLSYRMMSLQITSSSVCVHERGQRERTGAINICVREACGDDRITFPHCYQLPQGLPSCGRCNFNKALHSIFSEIAI